jgi:type IV pilus assembly PilO-like protein
VKGISPKMLALIAVGVVAVFALGGWFGLVAPQRSKASSLNGKIADTQQHLHIAKVLTGVEQTSKGKKSGLALLTIAMPETLQMPQVIQQVQSLANGAKVSLDSFAPTSATVLTGYDAVPINVRVVGRYDAVKSFLRKLRLQAGTKAGRIHASGRLFDVDSVNLTTGGSAVPNTLSAAIQLSVFVYTGTAPPTVATTTTTGG